MYAISFWLNCDGLKFQSCNYDYFSIQNLQDEMMDLMDESNEIQETLGRSYNVPDDIDEEELMGGKNSDYPEACPFEGRCYSWQLNNAINALFTVYFPVGSLAVLCCL